MLKLLLTAPHTQTYLSQAAVKLANLFCHQFFSYAIVNCVGLLVERNGEGERIIFIGDKYLMEQCGYLHLITIHAQEQQYIFCSLSQRMLAALQLLRTGCCSRLRHVLWKALVLLSRGLSSFTLINSTGSWTSKNALWVTYLCFGSEADPTGSQEGTSPFLSSAAKVTWVVAAGGGELHPAPAEALAAGHGQQDTGHRVPKGLIQ